MSPSRRSSGTSTGSIGASSFPAGARNVAQHAINAGISSGPYVGVRGPRGLTGRTGFAASRNEARA
jgi:hypothetical protein